jgi:hypothetical protein
VAKTLIDRIAGEVAPLGCWSTPSAASSSVRQATRRPRTSAAQARSCRCLFALGPTRNRTVFPAEVSAHAVQAEAVTDIIAFLVSDAGAPVSGAVVPAYGA